MNDRLIHDTQRLNDALFALVLGVAASCAVWLSTANAREPLPVAAPPALTHVQLERVVISAKRSTPSPVARAAAADPNS